MIFKDLYERHLAGNVKNEDLIYFLDNCDNEKVIKNNDIIKLFEIILPQKNVELFSCVFKNIKTRLVVKPEVMEFFMNEPFLDEKKSILLSNGTLLNNYVSEFLSNGNWESRDSALVIASILKDVIQEISYEEVEKLMTTDSSEYVRSSAIQYASENHFSQLMENIWLYIPNEWNSVVRRSYLKLFVNIPNDPKEEDCKKESIINNIRDNFSILEIYNDDDDSWIIDNLERLKNTYFKETENMSKKNDNKICGNSLLEIILLESQQNVDLQNKECYGD
uniref:Sister chromatid cohesion protein DCC1 n=1 Tax=Parastrongyloides trichosuri TaxID=131310 RepID=A0A0N4ZZ18_PARTI